MRIRTYPAGGSSLLIEMDAAVHPPRLTAVYSSRVCRRHRPSRLSGPGISDAAQLQTKRQVPSLLHLLLIDGTSKPFRQSDRGVAINPCVSAILLLDHRDEPTAKSAFNPLCLPARARRRLGNSSGATSCTTTLFQSLRCF
jgi:hypothetical protein